MFNQIGQLLDIAPEQIWIIQVFLVVLLTAISNFIIKRLLLQLFNQSQKTKNRFDDIFIAASSKPINWIVWIFGVSLAIEIIIKANESSFLNYVDELRNVGILSSLTWFLLNIVGGIEDYFKHDEKRAVDIHTVEAISKLTRLSVIITASLVILQALGFSISGILAFGGLGGIAIGFAAKDLLANFFGGLIVYLDRPFSAGDWIRSPDRSIEGTVEKIGWRITQIRTFDKRPLYVPNSVFSTIIVENPSRMTNRRIYENIGIRYDDLAQMESIVANVKQMLEAHEDIDNEQTLIVNFNAFSDSSVDLMVYTFTKTTNWIEYHQVKQNVLLRISEIIEQYNAEIAFPTSTLHLASMPNVKTD